MRRFTLFLLATLGLLGCAVEASLAATWYRELPVPEPVAEVPIDLEAAADGWTLGPDLAVVEDEILGGKVIENSGKATSFLRTQKPVSGPCEIEARVRIPETQRRGRSATLCAGVLGSSTRPDVDYSLAAVSSPAGGRFHLQLVPRMGAKARQSYEASQPASGRGKIPWPRSLTVADRYREISPVWDRDFRLEIEAAMAALPLVEETWFTLRIVHRPEVIQLYKDGMLVAERRVPGKIEGDVELLLGSGVRVASLVIRRARDSGSSYHPVRLEGTCNARAVDVSGPAGIRGGSLPQGGATVEVEGVPFVFAQRTGGTDHVDVGTSLFHYRHYDGAVNARTTWPSPGSLDPARILLRVPNRPYRRLWIVAAADGEALSVPVVTARFYRPKAGFCSDAPAEVPELTARSGPQHARRLAVSRAHGKPGSLWLVPIDLDMVTIGSRFREQTALALELTKQVLDHRAYPDPAYYGSFQGGLPSGVRIFALTLEEGPARLIATGNRTGNVYVHPEEPVWQITLDSTRPQKLAARVRLTVTDPFGKEQRLNARGSIAAGKSGEFRIPIGTSVYGLHKVRTEATVAGETLVEEGTFVALPPDTRRADAWSSRWGLWWWRGGHMTNPDQEEDLYLLRAAGTRIANAKDPALRRAWGMAPNPRFVVRSPAPWSYEDPHDPQEYRKFSEEIGQKVAGRLEESPDTQYFTLFAENSISRDMTYGILPRYIGEPEYKMDEQEQARFQASTLTAKAATEGIRKYCPKAKVCFGWCEATFSVPFMRAGYPKEYMDAVGVDLPMFERMPETPIRSVAPNRMWILKQERERLGYGDVPIIHTESYFPSSHRLALGPRTSADHYVRSAVLSLALGTSRLLYCYTLHDCADYWGTSHYGCIGIVGPRPEHNPKPAFPAYATMTRLLDLVEFDGYVPTGSLSAYCVRFLSGRQPIYCLWTLRGGRDAALQLARKGTPARVDENGNRTELELGEDLSATVTLTPTPIWVVSDAPLETIELGPPAYTERPGEHTVLLDPLDRAWTYSPEPYERYAENHWDLPRFPGPNESAIVESEARGSKVWQVALAEPEKERKLAAFYGVFTPPKPIAIPGKARALGVWANGRSNWGRIIYEIRDAKGETWQSVGSKDSWNCDDTHGWSFFNFDGWRYVEFPLPGHAPGDHFREKDTVWWNNDAEGIVDLPVKLTRVILEWRTHHVYVDQCLPIEDRSVQLDELVAVYEDAESMTDAPVKLQAAAAKLLKVRPTRGAALPNPIAQLQQDGVGAAPQVAKVAPPAERYDGTRVQVTLKPVPGAQKYRIYVSAYPDGRGAVKMAESAEPKVLVRRLRPDYPLYLVATYINQDRKESKPSAARRILLKDDFPMK